MIRRGRETNGGRHYRLALPAAWFMEARMVKPSPLDNRDTSKVAWARYRRLMRGMSIVSLLAVVGALSWLRFTMGEALTIHMMIATAAGVGLSVMLGAALMGLVFLSSGSGHDESIDDPFKDDPDLNP
jgi:hypothetical protein